MKISLTLPDNIKLLDVIMYLASLASNRQQVAALMNPVRALTAHIDFDEGRLAPADRAKLITARDTLVTYLITNEPVRAFTKEDLERRLQDRFEAR